MRDYEKALNNKPIEERLAASLISKNVLQGASWTFCDMDSLLQEQEAEFAKSETCSLHKIICSRQEGVPGYLVSMKLERLLKLLGPDNKGPLTEKDLELAREYRERSEKALTDRLTSGYEGMIGIYCTSDLQTITVNGIVFPSFTVTLNELCAVCEKLEYGIVIGHKIVKPGSIIKLEDNVIETLLPAPSFNALFICVAPMSHADVTLSSGTV